MRVRARACPCGIAGGRGGLRRRPPQRAKPEAAERVIRGAAAPSHLGNGVRHAAGVAFGGSQVSPAADRHHGNTPWGLQVGIVCTHFKKRKFPTRSFQFLAKKKGSPAPVHRDFYSSRRSELLDHLRVTRLEKRRLHRALREFEELFCTLSGRYARAPQRNGPFVAFCFLFFFKQTGRQLLTTKTSKHNSVNVMKSSGASTLGVTWLKFLGSGVA